MRIFGGHTAQITGVGWKVDQDYLFVSCDDGSLSLWGVYKFISSLSFLYTY